MNRLPYVTFFLCLLFISFIFGNMIFVYSYGGGAVGSGIGVRGGDDSNLHAVVRALLVLQGNGWRVETV